MPKTRKSFCVVCIANFCRSPVVENLLKKRFKDEYEFFSAGISPFSLPSMDQRSQEYLKQNNITRIIHNPKKINNNMLKYFDYFFAVDLFVLNELNKKYPKYKNKFILLTAQCSDINIIDPYKLQHDEYMKVMNNIKYITETIKLDKFK